MFAKYTKMDPAAAAKMTHSHFATQLTPALLQPLIDVSAKYAGFKSLSGAGTDLLKTIAIEEHFSTSMQRESGSRTAFRDFFLSSRSEFLGHNIADELADLDESRLRPMDAAGVDMAVLSFTSPGPQAFEAAEAIAIASDANDVLYETVKRHSTRFAGFAALPTADPEAAADELERAVTELHFKGAMIHGHTRGSFLDEKRYWVIFERAEAFRRADLPPPDDTSPGCDEGVLRRIRRTRRSGVGLCGRYELPLLAAGFRRRI